MVSRRSPPIDMPTTPTSQPLMTWPLPTLKEKGLPFLLAVMGQHVHLDIDFSGCCVPSNCFPS